MVHALVKLSEDTNRVLNVIKAKFGLKDKSKAIELMAEQYKEEILEPELRPEFIKKLQKIKKHKGIRFKSVDDLRKSIENA